MLLPALKGLLAELEYTKEKMPMIDEKAKKCLDLITAVRHIEAVYDMKFFPQLPPEESAAMASPSGKVAEQGDMGLPGTTLTGKTYFVPMRDLRQIYSYSKEIFLESNAVQNHWKDAVVDAAESESAWEEEKEADELPPAFAAAPPPPAPTAAAAVAPKTRDPRVEAFLDAALEDDPIGLRNLLDAKVSPNSHDASGDTALHSSCYSGAAECVSVLLSYQADPNIPNRYGDTALHAASHRECTEIIPMLLDAGANPSALNNKAVQAMPKPTSPTKPRPNLAKADSLH